MPARIIDGQATAAAIRAEIKAETAALNARGIIPGLAVILVGEDPASKAYVAAKAKACAEVGFFSSDYRLPQETTQAELMALIDRLNGDRCIHGILVQLPLPPHLDESQILQAISPDKDVDGFHPINVGKLVLDQETFLPCTPHGIVHLLVRSGVTLAGAHAVIVGRSNIVGKPLAILLMRKAANGNATVTVCHTRTRDLTAHTRRADILVAAIGRPSAITADMVKEGAVVIDVGINRVEDASAAKGYRLCGDVDFNAVKEKAGMITPVPGGVGPMTIAMLLHNTLAAAKRSAGR